MVKIGRGGRLDVHEEVDIYMVSMLEKRRHVMDGRSLEVKKDDGIFPPELSLEQLLGTDKS